MRERRRLDEAIGAVKAIETELGDTVELIELGEAEGDQALADDGVAALAALADRADKDKVSALLAGEADANDTYIEINAGAGGTESQDRSEEHTSELQSLMRLSYAVFCLKKKN